MLRESSDYPQKSLQIKQNDKFFSKLLTKESSKANPSSRIYYGDFPGAVPFVWESQPGTPKHRFSNDVTPPLTPPPSYFSNSSISTKPIKKSSRFPSFFHFVFPNFCRKREVGFLSPPKSRQFPMGGLALKEEEEVAGGGGDGGGSPTSILCFGIGRVSGNGLKNLQRFGILKL